MSFETEPPMLPDGEVILYRLSGEWGYSEETRDPQTRDFPRFREVPILSSLVVTADLAASLRRTLGYHHTFESEPMRCFIPRHGLQFGGPIGVDALICLECHFAYFWLDGVRVGYALSTSAVGILGTHFRSAEPASRGLDPAQILHEASFAESPDTNRRANKAW